MTVGQCNVKNINLKIKLWKYFTDSRQLFTTDDRIFIQVTDLFLLLNKKIVDFSQVLLR